MADWYYAKDGQQKGPVSSAELKKLAQAGEIGPNDLVFREGGTNWVEANTVAGLFPPGGGAVAAKPTAAGRGRDDRDDDPPRGRRPREDDDVGVLPGEDDDSPRIRQPRVGGSSYLVDLLLFKQFATPWVIIVVFWVGLAGILLYLTGLWLIAAGNILSFPSAYGFGFLIGFGLAIPLLLLYWRVLCELIAVQFRIYETQQEMARQLKRLNDNRNNG